MSDTSLYNFIEERLSWELSEFDDINVGGLASDLAYGLENSGYCNEQYFEFKKALVCPINKRREKDCYCSTCNSHEFCMMLRKEGYV